MSCHHLSCVQLSRGHSFTMKSVSGRNLSLSEKDQRRLRAVWDQVGDKAKLGRDIFSLIFGRKPDLKELFGLENTQSEAELHEHPMFRHHAVSFTMFLEVAVAAVAEGADDAVMVARNVGRRHTQYRHVSFDAANWLLFKNSVLDALTPFYEPAVGSIEAGRNVWSKFLMFLIAEMKDTFNAETRKRYSCQLSGDPLFTTSLFAQLSRLAANVETARSIESSSRSL